MTDTSIRLAYPDWAAHDARLRERVSALTAEQLAVTPSPERWPLWATIGHLACQRVFWLCDVAGEPGAETTRFTNAAYDCPGDDDLEHVLSADQLVEALASTFRIVEDCLDRWSLASLTEVVEHPEWPGFHDYTRGQIIQRVFAHDISHIAELNEALGNARLAQIDLWD